MKMLQLTKKHKILLGVSTAALTSAAVVTPLVSCNKSTQAPTPGEQYDDEFNVTEATYTNMKLQFDRQIDDAIATRVDDEIENGQWNGYTKDQAIHAKKQYYIESMNELDDYVHGNNGKDKKSITEVVDSMSEMAAREYNIQLNSSGTTAKLSDLYDDYLGAYGEAKTYMDNLEIPDDLKREKLDYAEKQYGDLVNDLQNRYGEGNTLMSVTVGRQKILTFFDGIEKNTSFAAAELKLKDFLSNYSIELADFDPNSGTQTDKPYYDDIEKVWQDSDNKIKLYEGVGEKFTVNGEEDQKTVFQKYFTVTNQENVDVTEDFTVNFFSKYAIVGYQLQPCIVACKKNSTSNENVISVDWQLTKIPGNQYATCNLFKLDEEFSVHLYKADEEHADELANATSVEDALIYNEELIEYKDDTSILHKQNEKEAIESTYFKAEESSAADIEFGYDEKPSLEKIWVGDKPDDQGYFTLTANQLADSGVYCVDKNDTASKQTLSELLKFKQEEEKKATDKQIPDEDLTGPQKFIKYCDFQSIKVKIEQKGNAACDATINAPIQFANTKYEVSSTNADPEWCHSIAMALKDLQFSDEYFAETNNAFNAAYNLFNVYENDELKIGWAAAIAVSVAKYLTIVAGIFAVIWLGVSMVAWGSIGSKVKTIIAIIIVTVALVLLTAEAIHFGKHYVGTFVKYLEGHDNFKEAKQEDSDENIFTELRNKFNNDKQYFVLADKDGKYDHDDYEDKKEKFKGDKTSKALHDFYCDFSHQAEYTRFFTVAKKYQIGKDQIEKKLTKDLAPPSGKHFWISMGTTIVVAALVIILKILNDIELLAFLATYKLWGQYEMEVGKGFLFWLQVVAIVLAIL